MELSVAQIISVTRGADHTEVIDGCLAFRRCTDAQTAAYARRGGGRRCRCTAGIRLDFLTDSPTLCLEGLLTGRLYFSRMSVDLYADGVMVCSDRRENSVEGEEYVFSYTFGDSRLRRLTLYLPYLLDLRISRIVLDDGACCLPYTDYAGRMLCFGDSITQGYQAERSSLVYGAAVARCFDFDWNNQGNAGYIFDADTIDPALNFSPDLITVAFGTNDWSKLSSRAQFCQGADDFFARLTEAYPGIPVIGISPLWRGDSDQEKAVGPFDEACAALREIITAHGCTLLDGASAVPHLPDFFCDGRLHPNDLGFSCYAAALISAIAHRSNPKKFNAIR